MSQPGPEAGQSILSVPSLRLAGLMPYTPSLLVASWHVAAQEWREVSDPSARGQFLGLMESLFGSRGTEQPRWFSVTSQARAAPSPYMCY